MYKAPYHPSVMIEESVTRFGALEMSEPELYHTPIKDKSVYRIDTLACLREVWGYNILASRDITYKMISGSCTDDELSKIMVSYYDRFSGFRDYVNQKYLFEDNSAGLIFRVVGPIRNYIDTYTKDVLHKLSDISAKVVMRTHDYVYFVLPNTTQCKVNIAELIKIV